MYQPYQLVSSGMQIHHPGEASGGAWMAYQDREGRPCWHNTATNQWTYNLSSNVGDGSTFYSTPSYVGGFPQMASSPAGIYTYWSQTPISTPTTVVGSPATMMGGWSSVTPTGAMAASPVSPFAMLGYSSGSAFMAPTGAMVPAPAPAVTYMSSGTPIAFMPQQQQQSMPFQFQSNSGMMPSTPTSSTPLATTAAAGAIGAAAGTAAAGMFGGPPLMTTPQPHPMYIDPNGPHAAMFIDKGVSSMQPFGPPAMGHFGPMPTDPSAFLPDWMRWPGMPGVFPGVIGGSKDAEAAPVSADEDGDGDGDGDGDDGEDGDADGGEEKAEEPAEEAKEEPPAEEAKEEAPAEEAKEEAPAEEAKEEPPAEEAKEEPPAEEPKEEVKEDEAKEEGGGDAGGDGGEEAPAAEPAPAEEPAPKEEPAPETPPPEVPPPKGTGS